MKILLKRSVLPGFEGTMAFTLLYLSLMVLLPIAAVLIKTSQLGWQGFFAVLSDERVIASLQLSFGASLAGAGLNAVFGTMLAWVLVRYSFPLKSVVDAMVDLPFALPTAVAGIALTTIYAPNGIVGSWAAQYGIKVAFTPLGIAIALSFIGLPFVVRSVQPILEDLETEYEEAAASLGASRLQSFTKVVWPALIPGLLTGFALAFARAVGEYGSVIFIAGNVPFVSEIAPLLIMTRLEQYDYAGATAIATIMLVISFVLLLLVNGLQHWSLKRHGGIA